VDDALRASRWFLPLSKKVEEESNDTHLATTSALGGTGGVLMVDGEKHMTYSVGDVVEVCHHKQWVRATVVEWSRWEAKYGPNTLLNGPDRYTPAITKTDTTTGLGNGTLLAWLDSEIRPVYSYVIDGNELILEEP